MSKIVYATRKFTFCAAHFLPQYQGKCANMHGHTYTLEVRVKRALKPCAEIPQEHMVMDFKSLDSFVNALIVEQLDHQLMNDHYPMPTAESMAIGIFETVEKYLPLKYPEVTLDKVTLWETENSFVEYMGETILC